MRMNRLAPLVAAAVAALLAACGGKPKDPTFEAGEYKSDKAAVTARYVVSPNVKTVAPAMKEKKKVFIPLFQVEFISTSSASSSSYSVNSGNSSSVRLSYQLAGIDTAAFVTVVDKLYADFVDELKAAGYDVVPKEELLATPQYQQLKARGEASNPIHLPSRVEGNNTALVVAPTGMGVTYFMSFSPPPGNMKSMWKAIKGDLPEAPAAALADSLKATPVLAQFVVGFVSLKDTHTKGSGNSSVSSAFQFTIAPLHSQVAFVNDKSIVRAGKNKNRWSLNAQGGAVAQIGKPIFGSSGWATGTRDITSTGSKVTEGIANAIGALGAMAGGGSSHSSKTRVYALDVNEDAYIERARDNLDYAQEMLVYALTHDGIKQRK